MELADKEVVLAYLASFGQPMPTRKPKERPSVSIESRIPRRRVVSSERTKCACGQCRQCEDNARWERIFNERFADPEYYSPRPTNQGSSLNSWK